jgi:GTP cyclohydrolase IA
MTPQETGNRGLTIEMRELETSSPGNANGISLHLYNKQKENGPRAELTQEEKEAIIEKAAKAFEEFLTALGCDWRNDPNSSNTPRRVAKAYMEKWKGRFEPLGEITSFPSDGYDGLVVESNIPLTSMCSHHHETIQGYVTIAYVPSREGRVVGLSKLNRIVEHFGRRGAIQEQLTVAIHNAIDIICEKNMGVAVSIDATHNCVSCRGVKHRGASMQTTKLSGCFLTEDSARSEFMMHVSDAVKKRALP